MRRGTRTALIAVALTSLTAGRPLWAQRPARLDTARLDTLRLYPLAPLVVTASRVPTTPNATGFATGVLPRREALPEPFVAARALAFAPAVAIDQGAGPGGPTTLHLRGAGEAYTQMLFDGVPVNISGGYNDIAGLLLTNVERVEVARGPLSALWGSSAMAGAVQFITRAGRAGPVHLGVLAEGGRAATRGGRTLSEVSVSGGSAGLRYSGGLGLGLERGVYAVPNDLLTRDASLRLDLTPGRTWTVTATARVASSKGNLPVRDAGATRIALDPNQRDAHLRWIASVSADWSPTPTWHHRLTASVLRDVFTYADRHDSLPGADTLPFFVFNFNFDFRSTLLRPGLEYVGRKDFVAASGAPRFVWSYGASWQREAEVNTQDGDFGPSRTSFGRSDAALFTELQGHAGTRVSGLFGARLERFEGLPAELTPRAGVVVKLVPGRLSVRAAAGRAFKAPNVDQQYLENPGTIPNPALRPERSTSWEVGADLTSPDGRSALRVGYFRQRFTGLIATVPADSGPKQTNKNLGSTRSSGIEGQVERTFSAHWRLGANATWVRAVVLDNAGLDAAGFPVGGTLPATPRITGSAYVSGDLSTTLSVLASIASVGRQTVFTERFSGRRVPVEAYTLAGLRLQWQASRALAVYLRMENLLDTRYAVAYDRPGVPRTVALGVRATS